MFLKKLLVACLLTTGMLSCSKDKEATRDNKAGGSTIVYIVEGTHFRLNYIDSNSVFQKDETYSDHFRYEFKKGSGANIGMSVFLLNSTDQIYSWKIFIDNKLYANAFSEGGAYLTVPYH
jgi:hypothetical protein